MKKCINTKKAVVAALILTIALFVFPLSSFSQDTDFPGCGSSNRGNIEDLYFDFGDGFPLPMDLSSLGLTDPFKIVSVEVFAAGIETTVVAPDKVDSDPTSTSNNYIYNAILSKNWKKGESSEPLPVKEKRIVYVLGKSGKSLVFKFKSAKIFEKFEMLNKDKDYLLGVCYNNIVPDTPGEDTDLFFEVTDARLIEIIFADGGSIKIPKKESEKFNLILNLEKNGNLETVIF